MSPYCREAIWAHRTAARNRLTPLNRAHEAARVCGLHHRERISSGCPGAPAGVFCAQNDSLHVPSRLVARTDTEWFLVENAPNVQRAGGRRDASGRAVKTTE